jgi:uncharacterized membrane protein
MPDRNNKSQESSPQVIPLKEAELAKEEHKELRAQIRQIETRLQRFSGPLPPPEAFEKYEGTLKGAANRILTMAEKQQDHRINMERKIVKSNSTNEKLGLIFGLVVALSAISGGIYCAHIGQTVVAVVIGGGGVVGLITAFVQGSKEIRREKKSDQQ